MALIKDVFKDMQVGVNALQFPAKDIGPFHSESLLKQLTDSNADCKKAQELVDVLKSHGLGFSFYGFTRKEAIYFGKSENPKNYFCRETRNGADLIIVVNKHFMLVIGEYDNPQLAYDGRHIYTTAGKRNAKSFMQLSFDKQAEFLKAVKVQMPLV
jgi:hypothetical protein